MNSLKERVITFGCRLNSYESEIIKSNLCNLEDENVVVVHSCAVTNEAESQVKKEIKKLNTADPNLKIIVAGCAAQLDPETYSQMPGVVKVLGNQDKLDPKSYISDQKVIVSDINKVKEINHAQPLDDFSDKSRASIEVQNGCNHSCTFCSITQARGNNRSLSLEAVIDQIRKFLLHGYNEVVFTGVDITDYGSDIFGGPSLGVLVKKVFRDIPDLKRLRLSSIDVGEIDDQLMELILHEKRLMPHFHLSVQSGNNLILKRMKRRHNREQVIEFCQNVRLNRQEAAFGADIIAGFPTETDDMFEDTLNLVKDANISYLHVFPYSSRKDTPAAKMPQVPQAIRKQRAALLREIGRKNTENLYLSMMNTTQKVIVEHGGFGRAENFGLIRLEDNLQVRSEVSVMVYKYENNILHGKML